LNTGLTFIFRKRREVELTLRSTGEPVRVFHDAGASKPLLAAHCVWLTEADVKLLPRGA
jgi:cytosine/adenosine deaminase-related metal-dependent hydrolase